MKEIKFRYFLLKYANKLNIILRIACCKKFDISSLEEGYSNRKDLSVFYVRFYLLERKARSLYRPASTRTTVKARSSKKPRNFIGPLIGATGDTTSFCFHYTKEEEAVSSDAHRATLPQSRSASIRSVVLGGSRVGSYVRVYRT